MDFQVLSGFAHDNYYNKKPYEQRCVLCLFTQQKMTITAYFIMGEMLSSLSEKTAFSKLPSS